MHVITSNKIANNCKRREDKTYGSRIYSGEREKDRKDISDGL
jgi:hypothetical protein